MIEPLYGIVANVASDRVFRTGARVWLLGCNGDGEHPTAYGLSKNGRPVHKFTHYKRLTNFRAAWIPAHMRERMSGFQYADKADAEAVAKRLGERWADVRYFNRDGSVMLKDGKSAHEALRSAHD
jgi:hypothetical protein